MLRFGLAIIRWLAIAAIATVGYFLA